MAVSQIDVYDLVKDMPKAALDKDYPKCRHASCPACSCDGRECMADNLVENAPQIVIDYRFNCPQLYRRAQKLMGRDKKDEEMG